MSEGEQQLRGRRRRIIGISSAVSLAILGGVSGTAAAYYIATDQAVIAQRAVDADRDASDKAIAGIRVEQQRYLGGEHSRASSKDFSVEEVSQVLDVGSGIFLPSGDVERVGTPQVGYVDKPQTRVFDQVLFTLVGQRNRPVGVRDIVAKIVSKADPPGGSIFWVGSQGAATDESIGFDLDSPNLRAELMKEETSSPEESGSYYFDSKYVSLAKDERIQFVATAFATTCSCEYIIEVVLDDGSTVTVDDNGKPWTITGFARQYRNAFTLDFNSGEVVPCQFPDGCHEYN